MFSQKKLFQVDPRLKHKVVIHLYCVRHEAFDTKTQQLGKQ